MIDFFNFFRFIKTPSFENGGNIANYQQGCVFGKTLYRIPTDEELRSFEKYPNITASDVLNEFYYTIVGRSILQDKKKEQIIESIEKLINLYPEEASYKEALNQAKELECAGFAQ